MSSAGEEAEGYDDNFIVNDAAAEIIRCEANFKPLHLVGVWEVPRTKNRQIVTVRLPSGLGKIFFHSSIPKDGKVCRYKLFGFNLLLIYIFLI